jgi:hypothetical protein
VVLQGAMLVLTQAKHWAGDADGVKRSSLGLTGSGLGLLDTTELHSLVLDVLLVSTSLTLYFLLESGLINEQS